MARTRFLQGFGVLILVVSIRPLRWGSQRPMCPNLGSGGSCTPNPLALVNRNTALDSLFHRTLDVVNDTFHNEFTEFSVLGSRTHGVAVHAFNRREDGLTYRSLAVSRPIDSRVKRVVDGPEETMLNQRFHTFFPQFLAELHPAVAFIGSEAAQVTCRNAGDLPAELCVVPFLGCTMNVEDSLSICVDESGRFQCLNAVIRPTAVDLSGVLAVEECGVDGGVTLRVVHLRRQAQQHSPDLHLEPIKRLYQRRVVKEIGLEEGDLPRKCGISLSRSSAVRYDSSR